MNEPSLHGPVPAHTRYPSTLNPRFDIGLIFSDAWHLLADGKGQFAAIFFAIQLPLTLVQLLAVPGADQPQGDLGNFGNLLLSAVIFGFLGLFATLNIMTAARYRVVGAPKAFYEVFLHAMIKFPATVFAAIIFGVVVFAGLVALIIPAIIFYIFGCCFLQAIALADQRIFGSLIESYEIVKGNWWNVFLLQVILFVMLGVVSYPVVMLDVIFQLPLAIKIVLYVLIGFVEIVTNLVSVMMFYNLLSIKTHKAFGV